MMNMTVILIPAYKPDDRLLSLVEQLENLAFTRIIIVDDGSGSAFTPVFVRAEEMGCSVIRHEENRGKGAALRTGISAAIDQYGNKINIVTADADGQHLPSDIVRVAETMEANPGSLVLGVRDFDRGNVPLRSYLGNRFTNAFFRLATGVHCADTQTGLRGISASLLPLAVSTNGDRYDYEMNFLTAAVKKAPLAPVPIETVYEDNNNGSHFRTVRDSLLIYKKPLGRIGCGLLIAGAVAAAVEIAIHYGRDEL